MARDPVALHLATITDLDDVTSCEVIQVTEDIALDVVVAVQHRVACAERCGRRVMGDGVPGCNQHVSPAVGRLVVDGCILDADSRNGDSGDRGSQCGRGRLASFR